MHKKADKEEGDESKTNRGHSEQLAQTMVCPSRHRCNPVGGQALDHELQHASVCERWWEKGFHDEKSFFESCGP